MDSHQITLRLQKIKLNDSENMKCADCSVGSTEYVLVQFGSFICRDCAEAHKSILNKVKLEKKGPWTEKEFFMVQAGGNVALKEFFLYYGLGEWRVGDKYRTRAAWFYREMLKRVSQNLQFDEDFPSLTEGVECFEVKANDDEEEEEVEREEERESFVTSEPLIVQERTNRPIGCFKRVVRYLVLKCFVFRRENGGHIGETEMQRPNEVYRETKLEHGKGFSEEGSSSESSGDKN